MSEDNAAAPVIITGMHRSGTTMLSGLLSDIGVCMGWSRANSEAVFFHKLNLAIERAINASWDNPENYTWFNACPEKKKEIIGWLKKKVGGPGSCLYYSRFGLFPSKQLTSIKGPWGWKDPRNTFTFDLWRDVFPGAKVIHVVRNAVDVAASLRQREINVPPPLFGPYSSFRVCDLGGGFSLWKAYVAKGRSIVPDNGEGDIMHLRYEDFLEAPTPVLRNIAAFCGTPVEDETLKRMTKKLDKSRSYSFMSDKELRGFYEKIKNDPLMAELGYSGLT